MARVKLRALADPKKETWPAIQRLLADEPIRIEDSDGRVIVEGPEIGERYPIMLSGDALGYVTGPKASAVAALLEHLAVKESEKRDLGKEVLDLYREVNLIYRFSEKLATQVDFQAVADLALAEARDILTSTGGVLLLRHEELEAWSFASRSGDNALGADSVVPGVGLLGSIVQRGQSEIVNEARSDPRRRIGDPGWASVICSPLRVKEHIVGWLVLGSSVPVSYIAADLKLLDTLALHTAAAIENAVLHERVLQTAKAETLQAMLSTVEAQKRKAEEMLLNILPASVADELQSSGTVQPMYFEDVTIVFTDFAGFSKATMNMAAEDVVSELHGYFVAFDRIIERYGLEKIKTIGDSYMFAAGLPERRPSNPIDAVLAAMEIVEAVKTAGTLTQWEARIGVHTGPVIAGVVGIRKFAFDIWGETVNVASRMESSGKPNRVNLSERTYGRIKDFIDVEPRGRLTTKDGVEMEMYFAKGIHAKLMTDLSATPPPLFCKRYKTYFHDNVPAFPEFLVPTS